MHDYALFWAGGEGSKKFASCVSGVVKVGRGTTVLEVRMYAEGARATSSMHVDYRLRDAGQA